MEAVDNCLTLVAKFCSGFPGFCSGFCRGFCSGFGGFLAAVEVMRILELLESGTMVSGGARLTKGMYILGLLNALILPFFPKHCIRPRGSYYAKAIIRILHLETVGLIKDKD